MSLFDAFFRRRPSAVAQPGDSPQIRFGFRGENVTYARGGRQLEIGFTYMGGPRLYTETIDRWHGGSPLTDAEKQRVFHDVVTFLRAERDRPIVVVNTDDPSRALWEGLCAAHAADVAAVEHTSDEAKRQVERNMYLRTLSAGAGLVIDGTAIRTVEELDRYLAQRPKRR